MHVMKIVVDGFVRGAIVGSGKVVDGGEVVIAILTVAQNVTQVLGGLIHEVAVNVEQNIAMQALVHGVVHVKVKVNVIQAKEHLVVSADITNVKIVIGTMIRVMTKRIATRGRQEM